MKLKRMNMTKEKELMAKSLKDVDNAWEMIAFIFAWRKRELLLVVNAVQFLVNLYLIAKYTNWIETLVRLIIK